MLGAVVFLSVLVEGSPDYPFGDLFIKKHVFGADGICRP